MPSSAHRPRTTKAAGAVQARGTPIQVLGIDPGSRATGWGIVEIVGSRLRGIDAGVIRVSAGMPLAGRLKVIFDGLVVILERHAPRLVAVEEIFYAKFARPALALGHVRGVALLAAQNAGARVTGFPPALVKRTVAGRGGAEKTQVAAIVCALLGWKTLPALDATDALAIAITGAQAARAEAFSPREPRGTRSAPRADRSDLSL